MSCPSGQNIIYVGEDNPVVFEFSFLGEFAQNGLNSFTYVTVELGGETYQSDTDAELFVNSPTELRLNIGTTTSLTDGEYLPTIKGYSPTYPNGYLINGEKKRLLQSVIVI